MPEWRPHIPEAAKWKGGPSPERIAYLRRFYYRDARLLLNCQTHEDRMSMGKLYYWHAHGWSPVMYDDDGLEVGCDVSETYRYWLQVLRRS